LGQVPIYCRGNGELAGLLGRQHGGLALAKLLAWRLHGECRVVLEHAAGDQVVEEHADLIKMRKIDAG